MKKILTAEIIAHLVYEHLTRDEQDEVLAAIQTSPEHFQAVANNSEELTHEMPEEALAQTMLRLARASTNKA